MAPATDIRQDELPPPLSETIRYSNQKIGEVPDSQWNFLLVLERTCTDFRNIHTALDHCEIYTRRSTWI